MFLVFFKGASRCPAEAWLTEPCRLLTFSLEQQKKSYWWRAACTCATCAEVGFILIVKLVKDQQFILRYVVTLNEHQCHCHSFCHTLSRPLMLTSFHRTAKLSPLSVSLSHHKLTYWTVPRSNHFLQNPIVVPIQKQVNTYSSQLLLTTVTNTFTLNTSASSPLRRSLSPLPSLLRLLSQNSESKTGAKIADGPEFLQHIEVLLFLLLLAFFNDDNKKTLSYLSAGRTLTPSLAFPVSDHIQQRRGQFRHLRSLVNHQQAASRIKSIQ